MRLSKICGQDTNEMFIFFKIFEILVSHLGKDVLQTKAVVKKTISSAYQTDLNRHFLTRKERK